MNHDQIKSKLYEFSDTAITQAEALEVSEHLQSCHECQTELEQWKKISRTLFRPHDFQVPINFSERIMNQIIQKHAEGSVDQRTAWLELLGLPRWEIITALTVFILVVIYSVMPHSVVQGTSANLDAILLSAGNGENKTALLFLENEIDQEDLIQVIFGSGDPLEG